MTMSQKQCHRLLSYFMVVAAFFIFCAATAAADDVEFNFFVPRAPYPPEITSVNNSQAIQGWESFTVYATIETRTQYEPCCDGVCEHACAPNCDFSECETNDFYGEPDPRIVPNPPCIPNINDTSGGANADVCGNKPGNPKLFYYYNGDTSRGGSVDMVYDQNTGQFKAEVPMLGSAHDTEIIYYIIAADSTGNVVSQVPDTKTVAMATISSWYPDYSTPALDNCTVANSYERCGRYISGTPTCFSSDYTVNDPEDDTCDVDGNPTDGLEIDDILGFSVSAGKGFFDMPSDDVVAVQVQLGANPPDPGTNSGSIEAYIISFYNPDIPDANPYDVHMQNSFIVTYLPEAAGCDPNLIKVLWDGECVTNPNTPDFLGCKLIVGSLSETTLRTGASGGKLNVVAKNALPNGDTIIGGASKEVYVNVQTGAIDLAGSIPFWLVDSSNAMNLMRENQTIQGDICICYDFPPIVMSPAECRHPDGSSFPDGICAQSDSEPEYNECYLTIHSAPDVGFVDKYNIYHTTIDDPYTATLVHTIDTNITGTNYYTYRVGDEDDESLDGKTHYFYLTSVFKNGPYETRMSNAGRTYCTVEDWVPSAAPTDMSCATPSGSEGICECTWKMNTLDDPSVNGFFISRDQVNINARPLRAVSNQSSYQYSYTDKSDYLETGGGPYTYRVKSLDAGSNQSAPAPDGGDSAYCTPEDLKKPAKIDSMSITYKSDIYGVDLSWEPGADDDIAGYNVYKCEVTTSELVDCQTKDDYLTGGYNEKINTSLIAPNEPLQISTENFPQSDATFCFWVEACDNCDTAGTCPSNGGEPNCSSHDTSKVHRKCLALTLSDTSSPPDLPVSVSASPLPEGGTCKVSFSRVTTDDEGEFENASYPIPTELMGYYLMRTEAIGDDCTTTPLGNPGDLGGSVIAKTISAAQQLEDTLDATDDNGGTGLTNGTMYCYTVYSFDAAGRFKTDTLTSSRIGACTPSDTEPPGKPEMEPITCDDYTFTLGWIGQTDKDTLTYNLYRCGDTLDNCTATDSYSLLPEGAGIIDTTLQDYNVTTGDNYTYCVTAIDAAGNESAVYESSSYANCKYSTPSDRPVAPDATTAWQVSVSPNYGAKACWTDSIDYDAGGQGYNIYACKTDCNGKDASSCCELKVETGYTGSHACTDGSEWMKNSIPVIETTDYYIGVTYVDDNGIESLASLTSNTVDIATLDKCFINPLACKTTVSLTNPVTKMLVEPCTGADIGDATACKVTGEAATGGSCRSNGIMRKCDVPISGIKVEIVPVTSSGPGSTGSDYGAPIKTGVTNAGGTVEFQVKDSYIQTGTEYVIRLRIDNYDPAIENMCDNDAESDGFCGMALTDPMEIDTSAGTVTMAGTPPTLPPDSSDGGFTGDIGNFNGDGKVDALDLAKMKPTWGKVNGAPCYRTWADVNLDGNINALDLAIMKKYWGKVVDKSKINRNAPGAMVAEDGWPPPECK